MASPGEIKVIFDMLTANYHYAMRDMTREQISNLQILWVQLLRDIDGDVLKAAALQHVSESKWFPQIAELRAATAEIIAPYRSTPVEQWGEVMRQIKRVGYYGIPAFADDITAAVVDDLIWRDLCLSENQTADRARFIQGYVDRQKREQRRAVQLPAVADAIARLAEQKRKMLKDGKER